MFAGKVYLELTFWSNAPPPEKKVTPKPPKANKQYGGPGSFVPSGESPSRIGPSGSPYGHSRPPSDSAAVAVPSSLRASNSLAKLDLYVPPYERPGAAVIDQVASEFSDLGISQQSRRESFPPVQYAYVPPPTNPYLGEGYQYDANQPPAPPRSSRHSSIPVSSSGFMPLNNSPSTFSSPAHTTDTYLPPLSHTPAPYNSAIYPLPTNYLPSPTPLPVPPNTASYVPPSTPVPFPSQPFPTPQTHQYIPYPPPTPVPPQQYSSPATQAQPQMQNGIAYPAYTPAPSSSHEALSASTSTSNLSGTPRPLPPQPQIVYASPLPVAPQEGAPPPPPPLTLPPPPPPPMQYTQVPPPVTQPQGYPVNGVPPVPPPPPLTSQVPPRRRASLPVPPLAYSPQQLPYQPPPPPPLPVQGSEPYLPGPIPPPPPPPQQPYAEPQIFNPGLPPKPPAQIHDDTQWQSAGVGQEYPSTHYVPNYA
ncbi:hypothetical protein P691DRAFT_276858 [Macrolepiota fuliginosa MF-IS2]|uniref:Uncharacterized protein n=1 Tax=Macrolepiota fuliginosa MF-IS2 TaxID=1400762 RepID=A0A9P5XLR4_9AGAR|nr:hypothetical protein P691DRAFT_276858 [Macrolepiota fuliginosa MF-IS2]